MTKKREQLTLTAKRATTNKEKNFMVTVLFVSKNSSELMVPVYKMPIFIRNFSITEIYGYGTFVRDSLHDFCTILII